MTVGESGRNAPLHVSSIQPTCHEGPVPLSWTQESIWFLDQIMPGQPTFNDIKAAFQVTGPLDLLALEQGLNEMVRRHESLRTTFVAIDGAPHQVVSPELHLALNLVDLSGMPPGQRDVQVKRLAMEAGRRPFDLTRGPLARVGVLRLEREKHVVLLTIHHIIFDVWSLGVAAAELAVLYRAARGKLQPPLPGPPIQYADFVLWQRAQPESIPWKERLDDWKCRLAGVPALDLPTDHPRPPIRSLRGAQKPVVLCQELSQTVRALSSREGVTPFMTLLAAFQIVLGRWSGQDDFAVGSPVANRTRPETESLLGYFINMLVLRADLSGNPTVRELLARVREAALDAVEHQEIPVELLIRSLNPQTDASRSPLFQVMFVLQNFAIHAVGPLELTITQLEYDEGNGTSKFDISLGFDDTPESFVGRVEFNIDLFEDATIDRMLEHFKLVLRGMAADPDRRLSNLPLLTEDERQSLIKLGTGPRRDYPVHETIHRLFEKTAAAYPERTAAVHNDSEITYANLNARANQIARLLLRCGMQPGGGVGILDHRGIDALAAMLGVFKAGGMFLSLDPGHPVERIQHMIRDSKVQILVSRSAYMTELPPGSYDGLRVLVDELRLDLELTSAPEAIELGTPPAYLIYTSGSTGLPKGAIIRHDGAVNHIFAEFDLLRFHVSTAFLQSAPSSSDISVWQYLAPLLIGGRTVIADFDTVCDPAALLRMIREKRITMIELVPVVMSALLEHAAQLSPEERALPDLEWAMVTGEAPTPSLVNQWLSTYPGTKLVNAYGPTEASDDVCQMVLEQPLEPDRHAVPIGRPLPNLTLYVLDRDLRLVPRGVPGEICISGIGVGAGYWNDQAKTVASFVPNPHAGEGCSGLLYRTGDLGRWLPDGTLECLERLDRQVKIRGFRIEPGEVEAALTAHPSVAQAAVVARDDSSGGRQLVAYVVPARRPAPEATDLLRHLTTLLPDYMLPTAFAILEALPLTPNGKVDRRALLALDIVRPKLEAPFAPPRSEIEERLAEIWCEVLGLDRVGICDDFFELGGHSLLVLKLWARIEKAFGQKYPVKLFFRNRTIERLAAILRQGEIADSVLSGPEKSTSADARKPRIFLLNAAAGLAQYFDDVPTHPLGFYTDEHLIWGLDRIENIAPIYIKRMREQQPEGPYRLVGFCGSALFAFEMARQLNDDGHEVSLLVLVEPSQIGLPPIPPAVTIRHYRMRLRHHLSIVASLPWKSWPGYWLAKVSAMLGITAVGSKFAPHDAKDFWRNRTWLTNALKAYRPGIYQGKVTLFLASQRVELHRNADFGWGRVAGGGLDVHIIPSDNGNVVSGPAVKLLIEEIKTVYYENIQQNHRNYSQ